MEHPVPGPLDSVIYCLHLVLGHLETALFPPGIVVGHGRAGFHIDKYHNVVSMGCVRHLSANDSYQAMC